MWKQSGRCWGGLIWFCFRLVQCQPGGGLCPSGHRRLHRTERSECSFWLERHLPHHRRQWWHHGTNSARFSGWKRGGGELKQFKCSMTRATIKGIFTSCLSSSQDCKYRATWWKALIIHFSSFTLCCVCFMLLARASSIHIHSSDTAECFHVIEGGSIAKMSWYTHLHFTPTPCFWVRLNVQSSALLSTWVRCLCWRRL